MAMTGVILIFYRFRSRKWFLQAVVRRFVTFGTMRLINWIGFGLGHAISSGLQVLLATDILFQQQDPNYSLRGLAGAIPGKFTLACAFLPGRKRCGRRFNYIF